MHLQTISLVNFRNYSKAKFDFGEATLVVGENGSGKSNLLEAIYLLAVGKSFRAESDYEMIKQGERLSVLDFHLLLDAQDCDFKVTLTDGVGIGRKKFTINGVSKRMADAIGQMRAVLFCPQDLELVTGSPSGRRRYLDFVIGQADREYRRCLVSYDRGLRQRNKLLEMIREGLARRNQLFFWDKLLIKNGQYLTLRRGEYLSGLGDQPDGIAGYAAVYDKSVISEGRLKQYEREEVAAAATLVGPHRDDFVVNHQGRDAAKYGSRGEQRMGVLWLKLGEFKCLSFGSAQDAQKPILLLDDIFSELDHRHRRLVGDLVGRHRLSGGQIIMTSADEHLVSHLGGTRINL